jgi:nucleotide-binding universal stress UspA family protein
MTSMTESVPKDAAERPGAAPLVVVGVDGSSDAADALSTAARAAERIGGRLRVVSTWTSPTTWGRPSPVIDGMPDLEIAQAAAIRSGLGDLDLPVERIVRDGWAGPALVQESHGAELLVVGRRGHGGFPGLLLGSVSMHCVAHATCPVLVVPPDGMPPSSGTARIVVGVDGSHGSQLALRLALRAADLVDARLDVVTVWTYPQQRIEPYPVPRAEMEEQARERQREAIAKAIGARLPARILQHVVEGHPAGALLEESVDADLLVVGSRGRGEISGTIFGSVSLACAEHARVPVLVARGAHAGDATPAESDGRSTDDDADR